jgi:hypothetical protein
VKAAGSRTTEPRHGGEQRGSTRGHIAPATRARVIGPGRKTWLPAIAEQQVRALSNSDVQRARDVEATLLPVAYDAAFGEAMPNAYASWPS